jgi:hypothetical protein
VVVVTDEARDHLAGELEKIERDSKKGRLKWVDTRHEYQMAYIRNIISNPAFTGTLAYASYQDTTDYLNLTVEATASAILAIAGGDHSATVFVDGLPKSHVHPFGVGLRQNGIRVRKVRGVRKEESDCLMRLADAACGFTRTALAGSQGFAPLFQQALDSGILRKVG